MLDNMNATDIFYTSLSTIVVMVILQITTFMVTRMLYPPEPRIIYRDSPVRYVQTPAPPPEQNGPVLTQQSQEIKLPEYEPRSPATTSLRVDPELPAGIQETRPPGT